MAGLAHVELNADCAACGLEGGVVEVYDSLVAACRFGIPARTRCKLCGATNEGLFDRALAKSLREIPANRCPACIHELGPAAIDERRCSSCQASAALTETVSPSRFDTVAALESAHDLWAEREKFPSRQALLVATFVEPDIEKLFGALQRREALAVLADPFANMGVRTTGGAKPGPAPSGERPRAPVAAAPTQPKQPTPPAENVTRTSAPLVQIAPPHEPSPTPAPAVQLAPTNPLNPPVVLSKAPPSAPPRAIVFPLVSVIAADGEIHPEERALVDRFLVSEGLAPLSDHEFTVHHPSAVAHFVPRERREEVVKLMCETAAIDGMPDESERRVIRAYATAWDVDDEKLDFWMWGYETMNMSLARQLFLKLRRFVLSARWSDAESK